MTQLEIEVAELRSKLDALAERVRLDAVAEAFLRDLRPVRAGDHFLYGGYHPTKLQSVSSDGKWTYCDPQGRCVEPFRTPNDGSREGEVDAFRLYTIAEVAEIVAKARKL